MKSKSYVKDFNAGWQVVKLKDKPGRAVRGIVTIELFDAAVNKKVLEARTENLITQVMLKHVSWSMKQNFFNGCPGTVPPEPFYPLTHIILCTSSEAEADEKMPNYGEIVGWCNKSAYSGTDTKRGTVNAAESYADESIAHWVFDWPTHAGNGTFQTIMWVPINESAAIPALSVTSVFKLWYTSNSAYFYDMAFDGEYIWICSTYNGTIYKKDKTSGANILTFNGPKSGHSGIAFDGQYLWVASYEYNVMPIIYKLSPANGSVLGSFSGPVKYCRGLAWDGSYLWYAGSDKIIYRLNPANGSVLSTFNVSYTPCGIAWDGQNVWVLDDGYKITKYTPGWQKLATFYESSGWKAESGLGWDGQYFYTFNDSSDVYLYRFSDDIRVAARTLLASPVTKTTTNVMKIQYDFIFEEQ